MIKRKYPINLNIENCDCLIIGGGKIAFRKLNALLEAGANVTVISKQISDEFKTLDNTRINIVLKNFETADLTLKKYRLIIAATNDSETNALVSSLAQQMNIPVNVVDIPELCSFYAPSTITRGDLTITISTNGKCPAFSKYLRKKLEKILPDELADILSETGDYRSEIIKKSISDDEKKKLINKKIEEKLGNLKW